MAKLLVLIVVIAVVYWIVKRYARGAAAAASKRAEVRSEDMVRCAVCGVHLPKSDSLVAQGAFFCSEEHRRAHAP